MTSNTQKSTVDLDQQIEMKRLEIIRDRTAADIQANEFRQSVRAALTSTPVKIGAGITGLLVARSLWRNMKASKRDRRLEDRRRAKPPSALTFKNVIAVATTSLAILEKLKRKDAEVEKKAAQVDKKAAEIKYQTGRDVAVDTHPYH